MTIGVSDGPNATGAGPRRASKIAQLEWMDSLYIDIIHSTTDLRGGLRKAREFTRPAWDPASGESSSPFYYELEDDDDHDTGRGADGDEDDDDDSLTHKDIMFFPYGAVVFWGCSEVEVRGAIDSWVSRKERVGRRRDESMDTVHRLGE